LGRSPPTCFFKHRRAGKKEGAAAFSIAPAGKRRDAEVRKKKRVRLLSLRRQDPRRRKRRREGKRPSNRARGEEEEGKRATRFGGRPVYTSDLSRKRKKEGRRMIAKMGRGDLREKSAASAAYPRAAPVKGGKGTEKKEATLCSL